MTLMIRSLAFPWPLETRDKPGANQQKYCSVPFHLFKKHQNYIEKKTTHTDVKVFLTWNQGLGGISLL